MKHNTEASLTEFKPFLNEVGITNELEQEKVISFFYTLGTIVYRFNCHHEKELD